MGELQQFFAQLIGSVTDAIPMGYAFGAGALSTVNPCGFAMLPVYLGLYLGARELGAARSASSSSARGATAPVAIAGQVSRAIFVALAVTGGFVLLFGVVGLVIAAGGRFVIGFVPWIALGIGALLVVLGIAMLLGHHLSASFASRIADRFGDASTVSVRGFFVFGVAYATASLSCTLPIFLTVVGGSLAVQGFAAAAAQFVSYALGMGLIILLLTMGIGVFKGAVVGALRQVLSYVERVSALLLIVAGGYIVYYWLVKGALLNKLG